MKALILNFLKKIKVIFNSTLDRIVESCDLILLNRSKLPIDTSKTGTEKLIRGIGIICQFLSAFPRTSIYHLDHAKWKIQFIGNAKKFNNFTQSFFKDQNIQTTRTRIKLWKIQNYISNSLNENIDLIICQYPHLVKTEQENLLFQFPEFINQSFELKYPAEKNLEGKQKHEKRTQIKKFKKIDFQWISSHSKEDFTFFYHNLYGEFIKQRHKDQAMISSYSTQYKRWFKPGGLILVKENERMAAGVIYHYARKNFVAVELGILIDENQYFQRGIKPYLEWCAIQQACSLGAETFDLGDSRAILTNSIFRNKKRWHAKVNRRKRIYAHFNFYSKDIPDDLRDYLNKLGIICETVRGFYRVYLLDAQTELDQKEERKILNQALRSGLDGTQFLRSKKFASQRKILDNTT